MAKFFIRWQLDSNKVILVSLSVALLFAVLGIQSICGSVLSANRTVGVQIGTWATYTVSAEGNMTANLPPDLYNISYFTANVTEINGTTVTFQEVVTFKNASTATITGSVDVETGSSNMLGGAGGLIAANLNQGDLIYTGSWSFTGATINGTTTRSYLSSNVEVCQFNLTSIQGTVGGPSYFYGTWDWFWLRDSGLLAEQDFNITSVQSGVETWVYGYVKITTSSVPEFSVSLILPLFVFLSTLVVVAAKKKLVK